MYENSPLLQSVLWTHPERAKVVETGWPGRRRRRRGRQEERNWRCWGTRRCDVWRR